MGRVANQIVKDQNLGAPPIQHWWATESGTYSLSAYSTRLLTVELLQLQVLLGRIELPPSRWQRDILPVYESSILKFVVTPRRVELRFSDRKSDVLTTRRWGRFLVRFFFSFCQSTKKGSLNRNFFRLSEPFRVFSLAQAGFPL